MLGGLFSKLLSLGTSIIRRKLIRNKGRWVDATLSQHWNFELNFPKPLHCVCHSVPGSRGEKGIITSQHTHNAR